MGFPDWTEIAPAPLRLPYAGVVYELPPVGINDIGIVQQAIDPDAERPEDGEVERVLLGDAGKAMRQANVPPAFVQQCLLTALADYRSGRAAAEMVWATAGEPGAIQAWLAGAADREAGPDEDDSAAGGDWTAESPSSAREGEGEGEDGEEEPAG